MQFNDDSKCDPKLGKKVFEHLKKKGYLSAETGTRLDSKEQIEKIKPLIAEFIKTLGLDLNDPQLKETPKRVAKMWVNELAGGLDWSKFPKFTTFPEGKATIGSFIVEKNCPFIGVCSHHMMIFGGIKGEKGHYDFGPGCTIAYIPNGVIAGISKFPRVVSFLASRPCNQEELANTIRETISFILNTEDVAVYMQGYHSCQYARGAKANGSMIVLSASGKFLTDQHIRSEFLAIARED